MGGGASAFADRKYSLANNSLRVAIDDQDVDLIGEILDEMENHEYLDVLDNYLSRLCCVSLEGGALVYGDYQEGMVPLSTTYL